jgi:hypothetical protein
MVITYPVLAIPKVDTKAWASKKNRRSKGMPRSMGSDMSILAWGKFLDRLHYGSSHGALHMLCYNLCCHSYCTLVGSNVCTAAM